MNEIHPTIKQAMRSMEPWPALTSGSHWLSDDGMASAQIEHDQNPTPPTSAEIYAMCQESDMADQYAKWICKAAGVAFPPEAA